MRIMMLLPLAIIGYISGFNIYTEIAGNTLNIAYLFLHFSVMLICIVGMFALMKLKTRVSNPA